MKVELLRLADRDRWESLLTRLDADVYHLPQYHHACEVQGDGTAVAFAAAEGDDLFLHPLMLRSIEQVAGIPVEGSWYDAESAYGYSGPLASTDDAAFLAEAWGAYRTWARAEGVVAEFVRFNPVLGNVALAPADAGVVDDRETIAVRLHGGAEAVWRAYPATQRNMVRKATAAGLTSTTLGPGDLPEFERLYAQTMARVGADRRYAFSSAYFEELASGLGSGLVFLGVHADDGELAAAALFLRHGRYLHYHLAGSDERHRGVPANNLLLHAAAEWGIAHDIELLHLGGGRTAAPDDSLLRFKQSISRDRLRFSTARIVHNRGVYDALCARWMEQLGVERRPAYFLCYRLEAA